MNTSRVSELDAASAIDTLSCLSPGARWLRRTQFGVRKRQGFSATTNLPLDTMNFPLEEDAGDLEQLPLEIRNKIYKFLLVEAEPITIKRYANSNQRRGSRAESSGRKPQGRGTSTRGLVTWDGAQLHRTSILLINHAVSQETCTILYGCNKFTFENARGLVNFLTPIDDKCYLSNILPCLRHVMLDGEICFAGSWKTLARSLDLVKGARNLRTFKFSHFSFCGQYPVDVKYLVRRCRPLL